MQKFEDFSRKFQELINSLELTNEEMIDKNYKLPTSDAIFCIEDIKRNRAYFDAINFAVQKKIQNKKNKDIVIVDAGAGTGILGIIGLLAGADKCIFIEQNPYTMEICKKAVQYFKFNSKSSFVLDDATKLKLSEKYDILVTETLIASLHKEDFIKIINNLRKYGKSGSIIIPEKVSLKIEEIKNNIEIGTKYEFFYKTKKGFKKKKLKIKNNRKLRFEIVLSMIDDLNFKSGDFGTFINPQIFDPINEKHPIFDIKIIN